MSSAPTSGRLSRRDVLKGLAAVGVGTATGAAAHGYLYARHQIEVTRTTLEAPCEEALDRVIVSAVGLLMAERPDLIVLGGDYVTWGGDYAAAGDRHFVEPAADAVRALSAPHGVYAVLGNHDDDRDMPAAMAARGIEILKDARTRLAIRGEILDLIGIRYWTTRGRDIASVARGAARSSILLAHNPARLKEAAELSLPLMLSGHTHGGQIVLPGVGAIAARSFPIVAGEGSRGSTTAFVSRGVGTIYVPVRINCPPEVAVLTLKPSELA